MDPDANHAQQVALAIKLMRLIEGGETDMESLREDVYELAELVVVLNDWVGNGGPWPSKGGAR